MSNNTKRTAGQRLQNLEESLIGTLKAMGALSNDIETIKEAIQLLGNKQDATIKLLNKAGVVLSDNAIADVMVQNNATKMAENTDKLVQGGILVKSEAVAEDSFVVGREVEDDGTVLNPRVQFTVESTQDHLKAKIMGAKVLDKILVEEGKAQLEVLEIYTITQPPAEAPAAQA